jgi:hypothetical protein
MRLTKNTEALFVSVKKVVLELNTEENKCLMKRQ